MIALCIANHQCAHGARTMTVGQIALKAHCPAVVDDKTMISLGAIEGSMVELFNEEHGTAIYRRLALHNTNDPTLFNYVYLDPHSMRLLGVHRCDAVGIRSSAQSYESP